MKNPHSLVTMGKKINNNKQTNNLKNMAITYKYLVKKFLSLYLYIEKDNKEK